MARIRSIHPGIWTDEGFAMLSMAARVLLFGIWTDADDHGVFEWKPVGLKMRIFPADKVDIEPLLDELVMFNMVGRFTHDGREYGAVRNFCKFQRPKKPTYKYPMPPNVRTYVASTNAGSEPSGDERDEVPHQYGTGSELSPQMEREEGIGEKKERKKDTADAVSSSSKKYAFESGVIRLTDKHFNQWKQAFSHLDLAAELIALTEWAATQPKWFHAVSSALAKRNREMLLRLEQSKTAADGKHLTADEKYWGVGRTPGIV